MTRVPAVPPNNAHPHVHVAVVSAVGLIAAAALRWSPGAPGDWTWLPLATVFIVGEWRILLDAWAELRDERQLSIDFLMGTAALGTVVVGEPFEGAVLIFLFSLSSSLEGFAIGRTRSAIRELAALRPHTADLIDAAGRALGAVPTEELRPGQLILVRPGERIAADGRVEHGRSGVDQSAITGEALPVTRTVGDDVFAGTIGVDGVLRVRVTSGPGETMLARIIRLVEEAREQRAPAQHFIDRFAHPYTLGVIVLTALAAVAPPLLLGTDWDVAFYRAITLLVVASPCALVISTPAAVLSGIANGARHGVLFKGGAHLDAVGGVRTIAFDKTGTLTLGRPRLVEVLAGATPVAAADVASDPEAARLLRTAAAVEQSSEHHLARAIVEAATGPVLPAGDFTAYPGEGVVARVGDSEAWLGNAMMVRRRSAEPSATCAAWVEEQAARGRSAVYVGVDHDVIGALAFGDTLKPGAAATVRQLRAAGVRRIVVLSGDHPAAVQSVTAELNADDVFGGLLPDEKVAAIRALAASDGSVAMVGDGINDAPAMAAATIGIAMGAAGTDVAIQTADVVLMSDEIDRVDYAIRLGRRTRRVVRQNFAFSLGWMLVLMLITAATGIPLPLAVVAHEGSTLLVAANGLRLLAGRPAPIF